MKNFRLGLKEKGKFDEEIELDELAGDNFEIVQIGWISTSDGVSLVWTRGKTWVLHEKETTVSKASVSTMFALLSNEALDKMEEELEALISAKETTEKQTNMLRSQIRKKFQQSEAKFYASSLARDLNDVFAMLCQNPAAIWNTQDPKVQLKPDQAKTLLDKNWIADEVIHFYLQLITERNAREQLKKVTFLYCYLLKDVKSGMNAKSQNERIVLKSSSNELPSDLAKALNKGHDSSELVFLPSNVDKNHWYMICFDVGAKVVWCYDPFQTYTAIDSLKEKLPYFLQLLKLDESELKLVVGGEIQNDGYDCGLHCMGWAQGFARGNEVVELCKTDRLQIIQQIMAGIIGN